MLEYCSITKREEIVVGCYHTFHITSAGGVYGWGCNNYSQLGIGLAPVKQEVPTPVYLPARSVIIAAGQDNSFLLTEAGELYGRGCNHHTHLGLADSSYHNWTSIPLPVLPIDVMCGDRHTLILTSTGEMYGCGTNDHGQLGFERTQRPIQWMQIPSPCSSPVKVIAGAGHSFLLSAFGELYGCGANYHGQLGTGDLFNREQWVLLPTPAQVTQVVTGFFHSLLLTVSGEMYGCGNNDYGQLGLGDKLARSQWTRLPIPVLPIAFAVGFHHSLLLTATGELYGCGDAGPIGIDPTGNSLLSKKWVRIPTPVPVAKIAARWDRSFFLAVTGEVYATGSNSFGSLGTGDSKHRREWTRII